MAQVRRVLGRIAFTWLFVHVGALVLSPVLTLVATAAPLECTCAHGDHSLCPMHHAPKPGSRTCSIQASDHGGMAALSPLFSGVGLPAARAQAAVLEHRAVPGGADSASVSLRPVPPDPPPPRA
jgi:hypothetical protein